MENRNWVFPTIRSYSYLKDSCPKGTRPVHNCMNSWLGKLSTGFPTSWKRYISPNLTIFQNSSPTMQKLNENPAIRGVFWFMGKMYVTFFLPHCFLPFAVLTIPRIIPVLKTTYGLIYIFYGSWPLWAPVAKMILKPVRPEKKEN